MTQLAATRVVHVTRTRVLHRSWTTSSFRFVLRKLRGYTHRTKSLSWNAGTKLELDFLELKFFGFSSARYYMERNWTLITHWTSILNSSYSARSGGDLSCLNSHLPGGETETTNDRSNSVLHKCRTSRSISCWCSWWLRSQREFWDFVRRKGDINEEYIRSILDVHKKSSNEQLK